jgi:hypothetical protein
MGSGELVGSYSSSSEGCESEDASAPCSEQQSCSALSGGIAIPYTRCVDRCPEALWVWVSRIQRARRANRAASTKMQKALRFAISLHRPQRAAKCTDLGMLNAPDFDGAGARQPGGGRDFYVW